MQGNNSSKLKTLRRQWGEHVCQRKTGALYDPQGIGHISQALGITVEHNAGEHRKTGALYNLRRVSAASTIY